MTGRYDAIVIGAGHNGLVAAAELARAGRSVLVLEAAETVGGAAATHEFAPGFRVSSCAHLLHMMPPDLLAPLSKHGLTLTEAPRRTLALSEEGQPLELTPGRLTGMGDDDAAAFSGFASRMARFAKHLAPLLDAPPPRLGTDRWSDLMGMLRAGWNIRTLGRRDMRELLRILGMNVYDLLEEHFDSGLLKGALALDAVLGSNFGPRSPGSVLTLLYRLANETAAKTYQPLGGMGAVTRALADYAVACGAEIRTGSEIARILVDDDRVVGVENVSRETFSATTVLSNADPKRTFLGLLGARHLDAGFVRRVGHIRMEGLAAKLHLALDGLPQFAGIDDLTGVKRLLAAPSPDYVERAFNHSKYGEFSEAPALEITLPTLADPSLAPPGRHVLSAIVQYAPYNLRAGWENGRRKLEETVLKTLETYAPGLRRRIVASELLTPADLEARFGVTGGHWHQGALAFDQFFMLRPVPGAAQYRTPVKGLYLCGAGSHPGGGVMGRAGRNAARQVLREQSLRKAA